MESLTVVESLSQREKNAILGVLQRDEKLRHQQDRKISDIKKEIKALNWCSVLKAGEDSSKICLRCHVELGIIFNRGDLCPACRFKVCKQCQVIMFNGSWLCKLCYKQRQLKCMTGEWATTFEPNPLRKWASGSSLSSSSLQFIPGNSSIDIGETSSVEENKQGRKASKIMVGGSDQCRSRVEVPKEADQHKLSELFNVLRVKKSEETKVPLTVFRKVTSRHFSESDSDSSSSSDLDVRSISTAPSMTESELDSSRVDSPKLSKLPQSHQTNNTVSADPQRRLITNEITDVLIDAHQPESSYKPKPTPRLPTLAVRSQVLREPLTPETRWPVARSRTPDKNQDSGVAMSMETHSHCDSSLNKVEQIDDTSVPELDYHVENTQKSLKRQREMEQSKSQLSLNSRNLNSSMKIDTDATSKHEATGNLNNKHIDNHKKESRTSDNQWDSSVTSRNIYNTVSSHSKSDKKGSKDSVLSESQILKQSNQNVFVPKDIKETEYHSQNSITALKSTGLMCSFPMESIPSSKPSTTLLSRNISTTCQVELDNALTPSYNMPLSQAKVAGITNSRGDHFEEEKTSNICFEKMSKATGHTVNRSQMKNLTNTGADLQQRQTQSQQGLWEHNRDLVSNVDYLGHLLEVSEEHVKNDKKISIPASVLKTDDFSNRRVKSECEEADECYIHAQKINRAWPVSEILNKLKTIDTIKHVNINRADQANIHKNASGSVKEFHTQNSDNALFNTHDGDAIVQETYIKPEKKVRAESVIQLLSKKPESLPTKNNTWDSFASQTAEDLLWCKENVGVRKDSKENKTSGDAMITKRNSSKVNIKNTTTDNDQKSMESGSFEGMIDRKTKLQIKSDKASKNQEADLGIGFNLNPVSPLPDMQYKRSSNDYKSHYVSDDNQDLDSIDDRMVQDANENFGKTVDSRDVISKTNYIQDVNVPEKMLNNGAVGKETVTNVSLKCRKRPMLTPLASLDLLVFKQANFIDRNIEVELDEEYQTALESIATSEKINTIAKEESSIQQNTTEDMQNESQLEVKNGKLFLAKNMCVITATNNSLVENMTDNSKQLSSQDSVSPQRDGNNNSNKNVLKPKLQLKSSLDILLDKQYDNVENNEAYTELYSNNLDKSRRDLNDCLPSQQKKAKTEYVCQHVPGSKSNVGDTVTSHMEHISGDKRDEFNQIFDDAKAYLDECNDSNKVVTVTVTEPDQNLQLEFLKSCILQTDSDSDMLSVIDENEEESDDIDDKDIIVASSNLNSKHYTKDVLKNEKNHALKKNPVPVNKLESVTQTKFLEEIALTTDEDEDMKGRTQSSTDRHHGEPCESAVTEINNNYFERKVVEKDMEQKYGMSFEENTRLNDKINDLIKKTDNVDKIQIDDINDIMNSSSICMPNSNKVSEIEIEDKVDVKTINNLNVAINYQNLPSEGTIMAQDISNREMKETLVHSAKEISWPINDDESCCVNTKRGKVESGAVTNNITDNKIVPNIDVYISDKYEECDIDSDARETKVNKKQMISNFKNMDFRENLKETTDTEEDNQNDGNISHTQNCMVDRPINEELINEQIIVSTAKKPNIFKIDEILNTGETETSPDKLSNIMNDTFSYIDHAVNDDKVRCHSIPNMNNFGNLPEICIVASNDTDDIQTSNFNSRSLSNHNKPAINDSDRKINDNLLSTHDSVALCRSLSAGNSTLIYHVTELDEDCHSIDEHYELHMDSLPKNRVCQDDDGVCVKNHSKAHISEHRPVARLCVESKSEDDKLHEQKSRTMLRAQLNLQVTADQQIILSDNTSNEAQPHKAPARPHRTKNRSHTSTVPSSHDRSTPLSSGYNSESPRTDIDALVREKLPSNNPGSQESISECSSQDDSGHVSGGSHDAMPDHKRTDSNLSGSSRPSIQSTDDDEDIDKTVAMLQKQFGNRSYMLSVVGDSCESLTSVYSDAGGIANSNIPVSGEIQFSLNYNYKINMLEVGIKQCRDIAIANPQRKKTDPYVKTYLLPDRTRSGKRKTKVKKHTTCPVFDETIKYSIAKSQLKNRTLWVTVWHNSRFGHNVFLGEVNINFDYYKFKDSSLLWYILQCHESQSTSGMVYKGELSVALRYVTANKVPVASQPNKSRKEHSKGQLEVMVKEAHNLTAVRSNGFSDPFCKGYLLPEHHKGSKQKTPVIKKNCHPVWKHTFIFEDVTQLELEDRCLELTVWDHEKLASNDFLGGVRLNMGLGISQGVPVDWMDGKGEEISIWQTMLSRPNIWIDGTLNLRPNMDAIKL